MHLFIHDPKVVQDLLLVGQVLLPSLSKEEVEVRDLGRRVAGLPNGVVQRRRLVGERLGDPHPLGDVPCPDGQREAGLPEQLGRDALEEVEVGAVEGEEEPGEVDLHAQVRAPRLAVRAGAVSAVDVGLLVEAARVRPGQRLHQRHRARVLGHVLRADGVHRPPRPERLRGFREREVDGRRRGRRRAALQGRERVRRELAQDAPLVGHDGPYVVLMRSCCLRHHPRSTGTVERARWEGHNHLFYRR